MHGCRGILLQLIAVLCLLFIDVHQVLLEDPPGEGGFHLSDAVLGEIPFLGGRGEDHHVDMDALLFFVEGSIPSQVIRMYLVALGDVAEAGIYQGTPVFCIVIPQPLRVLPTDRHHWCPHVPGVFRHLPYRLSQILHLSAAGPEAMLSPQLHAGAVGHVVQVVLPLTHGHRKVLSSLSDELRSGLLCRVLQVVGILKKLPGVREGAKQPLDIGFLFLGGRQTTSIGEHLHTGASGKVADTVCSPGAVSAAFEIR